MKATNTLGTCTGQSSWQAARFLSQGTGLFVGTGLLSGIPVRWSSDFCARGFCGSFAV